MINFIGVGAQKSGTSWIYANLFEHPEICAPVKEIHFFSRDRFEKGKEWYESYFKNCKNGLKKGEFSTSYLYSDVASSRIHELYPDTKIIAVLRNPIDRAYSQYRNAIKAGEISESETFETYIEREKSALEQGRYYAQLSRYLELFPREQMLVLVMEDIDRDKAGFMRRIYEFLGVDPSFISSMLEKRINVDRTPRAIWVESTLHFLAESLRKVGFSKLVHRVRQWGAPDLVRSLNTKQQADETPSFDRTKLAEYFREDAKALSKFLGRDMVKEWVLN